MLFKSINPKNGSVLREAIPFLTRDQIDEAINVSYDTYQTYKVLPIQDRLDKIKTLRENLETNVDKYAEAISKFAYLCCITISELCFH